MMSEKNEIKKGDISEEEIEIVIDEKQVEEKFEDKKRTYGTKLVDSGSCVFGGPMGPPKA